jgi:AcrR family transcriptional regulator
MGDIARAAGLSVGQIYRYFDNKEALIAAIVQEDLANKQAKFAEFEATPGPIAETLINQCGSGLEHNYDLGRAALMMEVLAESARNAGLEAIVRDADANGRAMMDKLMRKARPDDSEAERAARGEVITMLFDGMAIRAINYPDGDRVAIAKVLKSVMRTVLLGD